MGWVRAQINIAPYNADDNEVLVIASGKCNNAPEFRSFAARLNPQTMSYERDDDVNIAEWEADVGNARPRHREKKTSADVLALVPATDKTIAKRALISRAQGAGIGIHTTEGFISELIDAGELFEHERERPGVRPELRFGRFPPPPPPPSPQNAKHPAKSRWRRVTGPVAKGPIPMVEKLGFSTVVPYGVVNGVKNRAATTKLVGLVTNGLPIGVPYVTN